MSGFRLSADGSLAAEICRVIQSNGKEAWIVGGAVRDMLLGKDPSDFDIATSAPTDQIMRLFCNVIPTGIKHGTVTVLLGGKHFEVTTFRGESGYADGRQPDMIYPVHSIQEDLARRDFSMNALAYDPIGDRFCDPYGGAADILLKRIRCVGDPMQRFTEDGLRCLRACRFAATLGFDIEAITYNVIPNNIETYKKVSAERIVQEWKKALKADKPSRAFWKMATTDLLETTVPEFVASYGCVQNKYHAYDVFTHVMAVLDAAPKNEMVQLAALFHDIAKPACKGVHPQTGQATFYNHEERGAEMTREIMTRLKFSSAEVDKVSTLVRHHLIPHAHMTGAGIRRWIARVGAENVDEILMLAQADLEGKGPAEVTIPSDFVSNFRRRVERESQKGPVVTKTKQLAISGHEVMFALGEKSGPKIGETLEELLQFVIEFPEKNTREDLLLRLGMTCYKDEN